MQIGRKIYFDNTGNVSKITESRMSNNDGVIETTKEKDFLSYQALKGLDSSQYDFIQLAYGEREDEIRSMGSAYVDPSTKDLTIYPILSISVDKPLMLTIETATITATTQDDCTVNFKVDDGEEIPVQTVNKQAEFTFESEVPDTYHITATAELYGSESLEVVVSA